MSTIFSQPTISYHLNDSQNLYANIIITEDINMNWYQNTFHIKNFKNGFNQVINQLTRITNTNKTIID